MQLLVWIIMSMICMHYIPWIDLGTNWQISNDVVPLSRIQSNPVQSSSVQLRKWRTYAKLSLIKSFFRTWLLQLDEAVLEKLVTFTWDIDHDPGQMTLPLSPDAYENAIPPVDHQKFVTHR